MSKAAWRSKTSGALSPTPRLSERGTDSGTLHSMSFLVKGFLDDHSLSTTIATAKEAFAKAIEWHDTGRFSNVTISDDSKSYSIVAFALAMAHLEIAKTGNDAGDASPEAPARNAMKAGTEGLRSDIAAHRAHNAEERFWSLEGLR